VAAAASEVEPSEGAVGGASSSPLPADSGSSSSARELGAATPAAPTAAVAGATGMKHGSVACGILITAPGHKLVRLSS
jgi:hypothetical protein